VPDPVHGGSHGDLHRFWSMRDPAKRNLSRIILLGNTAILAGCSCSSKSALTGPPMSDAA